MTVAADDPVERALAGGAPLPVVLDVVDDAIERAAAAGDSRTLDRLAASLEATASERGREWDGLSVAATRARTLARSADATSSRPSEVAVAAPPRDEGSDQPLRFGGWWRRTIAFVVDWFLIGTAYALLDSALRGSDTSLVWIIGLPLAYFAGMHAFAGGVTVGKGMLGVAVRVEDGDPIGLGRATARAVTTFILWLVVLGGIVDMVVGAADPRRQWLHDKIAGTIVVHTRP